MGNDKEVIIDMIREDIREIKSDIKQLLSFKWKIIGGSVGISTLISVLVAFVAKMKE